ncbi:hypothetical protein [Paraburkholderia sediminicola]|uniref:hypothetical protein n=1 Tax=Paraburkholderia sediminicola TaxID=458836 RepID=UPI0038BA60C0
MLKSWSPSATIGCFVAVFIALSGFTSFVGAVDPLIYLNENQILYLFSTSAQVVAGIYGLTLTGFIFFRNELSREEFEDDTLADAIESLKKRYFSLLLFVTAFAILTLLMANLAISYESAEPNDAKVIIINSAQSAFIISLFAIAYFIFEVASPKRIEGVSKRLQNKLDPSRTDEKKGNLEDFVRNYNEIESLLIANGWRYDKAASVSYETRAPKRLPNSRLAEILFRSGRITQSLFQRLRELITLRNSIIHGADPVVSQDIVQASGQVLQELRSALGGEDNDLPR